MKFDMRFADWLKNIGEITASSAVSVSTGTDTGDIARFARPTIGMVRRGYLKKKKEFQEYAALRTDKI
jgi:hypothetical protein